MKNLKFNRLLMLLAAFLTMSINLWAESVTLTSSDISGTPTASPWNAYSNTNQSITAEDESIWLFDGTMHSAYSGTPYSYLQLGQKSGLAHTPTVSGNISQIVITATGAASGRYLQIEDAEGNHIGDAKAVTQSSSTTPGTYTFSITGSYSQLNIANHDGNGGYSGSNNAINIYSIEVTYSSGITYTDD